MQDSVQFCDIFIMKSSLLLCVLRNYFIFDKNSLGQSLQETDDILRFRANFKMQLHTSIPIHLKIENR